MGQFLTEEPAARDKYFVPAVGKNPMPDDFPMSHQSEEEEEKSPLKKNIAGDSSAVVSGFEPLDYAKKEETKKASIKVHPAPY